MSSCLVRGTKALSLAALSGSLVQELSEAKICLIHETVVQHKNKFLGPLYGANLTIVKIHNCPIYTRCCESNRGCCFDYPWFWSSVGVVLFLLFMTAVLSVYYWYKRKRAGGSVQDSVISASGPVVGPEGGFALPMSTFSGPRVAGFSRSGCPKPPAYEERAPPAHSSPQPGRACSRSYGDAPPPYTLLDAAAAAAAAGSGSAAGAVAGSAGAGAGAGAGYNKPVKSYITTV